jgi:hypothetical protein
LFERGVVQGAMMRKTVMYKIVTASSPSQPQSSTVPSANNPNRPRQNSGRQSLNLSRVYSKIWQNRLAQIEF